MSLSRFIGSRLHRVLGVAVATFVAFGAGALRAVEAPSRATQSEVVLTTFEQIWRAADNEPSIRHPVRFDFVVYYYDPLWRALWGRSGDADSYLSLGPTVFPIKAGQRIRVEGTMLPSAGMTVDEPKITILDDSAPLDVLSTAGKINDTERFNKRMVTVDGYVDGQTARDANHLELRLIVEGHVVTAELPIKSSAAAPAFKNQMVRLRGVYFARNEPGNARLEVWVPGPDAIASLGAIDGEARFSLPVTPIAEVAKLATGAAVHVSGACRELEPGRRLTIHDDSGDLAVPVAQTRPVAFGERVDVVGVVSRNGGEVSIAQALYRAAPKVLRSIDELYELPESEMQDPHPFHTEVLVYYFDPYWRVVWGRDSSSDTYLSFSSPTMPFKGGQRILVEGTVVPAKGSVIENARVQILDESVPLHPLSTQGQVGAVERFNRRFVTVEGYVDRQVQTDLQHVELDLVAEDRLVTVRLLSANAPPLEGTLARVRGVYSATTDPAGGRPKIEVWAESNDAVALEGNVDHDPRFNIPATPIDHVASAAKETPLRVLGSVWSQQPGRSVTLRDATGLLTVRSVQLSRLAVGVPIEAIGYPAREGADVFLAHGFYRHATTAITNTRDAESLRLAGQVRDLAPEEAARGRPVHLTGVVTWAAPKADFFFIRDISGGVYVAYPHVGDEVVPVGRRADVWGVSAVGDFVPIVTAARLLVTGDVDLPEARPVTLEQALTGVEEAQWVSMTG